MGRFALILAAVAFASMAPQQSSAAAVSGTIEFKPATSPVVGATFYRRGYDYDYPRYRYSDYGYYPRYRDYYYDDNMYYPRLYYFPYEDYRPYRTYYHRHYGHYRHHRHYRHHHHRY